MLSVTNWPPLAESGASSNFPPDVIARAKRYISAVPGGLGAYSHSQGLEVVREEVAAFITRRDGVPAYASDIFLSDGASPAAQAFLKALIRDSRDAVMVPIPQYPLYSASIALFGGTMVNYYLEEERGWALDEVELERSLADARAGGKNVRCLVVINPGNPTGSVLSRDNMRVIIDFARRHGLVLIADEVYQENVWASGREFSSFKKVAAEMGAIDVAHSARMRPDGLQLVSLHSISKGFTGECGRRGGYFELIGFDEGVRNELYKLASISLCSNTSGQLLLGMQSCPPVEGDPSYPLYAQERVAIHASLKRRASTRSTALRSLEGVTVEDAEGALYAFPRIRLPARAIAAAKAAGKAPDAFYCLHLLDATGIVLVPGSGFGQRDGTFHFRSTILPPERDLAGVVAALASFHSAFMKQFA